MLVKNHVDRILRYFRRSAGTSFGGMRLRPDTQQFLPEKQTLWPKKRPSTKLGQVQQGGMKMMR
ncbi:hypothetical protein SULPSESMR1_01801 [Pseudosulfitobacter pseudonitzschiae]|uniref:Uncharacterized protein n=1 Tax=Pseudosulfitobacter pseudonitzschiae TaxID=1402135 RepID=A0A221K0V9_9RHOB|nr:hypothetical protein SULPSESMR1_01801 [Pseudosulfitobacter pseudonitzschiae]